jgi:hypothetical protein
MSVFVTEDILRSQLVDTLYINEWSFEMLPEVWRKCTKIRRHKEPHGYNIRIKATVTESMAQAFAEYLRVPKVSVQAMTTSDQLDEYMTMWLLARAAGYRELSGQLQARMENVPLLDE